MGVHPAQHVTMDAQIATNMAGSHCRARTRPTMTLCLATAVVALTLWGGKCCVVAKTHPEEVAALLEVRNSLGSRTNKSAPLIWEHTILENWKDGTDPCDTGWKGVMCNCESTTYDLTEVPCPPDEASSDGYSHVYGLSMEWDVLYLANGWTHLKGNLSDAIGQLPRLRYLDLSRNNITGSIPDSIQDLSDLEMLALFGNVFEGPLPPWLLDMPSLRTAMLYRNKLYGRIPPQWCDGFNDSNRSVNLWVDIRDNVQVCGVLDSCLSQNEAEVAATASAYRDFFKSDKVSIYSNNHEPEKCCDTPSPSCTGVKNCGVFVPDYWVEDDFIDFNFTKLNSTQELFYQFHLSYFASDMCTMHMGSYSYSRNITSQLEVDCDEEGLCQAFWEPYLYRQQDNTSRSILEDGFNYTVTMEVVTKDCASKKASLQSTTDVFRATKPPRKPEVIYISAYEDEERVGNSSTGCVTEADKIRVSWAAWQDPNDLVCCDYWVQITKGSTNVTPLIPLGRERTYEFYADDLSGTYYAEVFAEDAAGLRDSATSPRLKIGECEVENNHEWILAVALGVTIPVCLAIFGVSLFMIQRAHNARTEADRKIRRWLALRTTLRLMEPPGGGGGGAGQYAAPPGDGNGGQYAVLPGGGAGQYSAPLDGGAGQYAAPPGKLQDSAGGEGDDDVSLARSISGGVSGSGYGGGKADVVVANPSWEDGGFLSDKEPELAIAITDLENSTGCAAADKAAYDDVQSVHDEVMRELISQFGGFEIMTEGDSFQVAFRSVASAVQWAAEVQVRLLEARWSRRVLRLPSCNKVTLDGETVFCGPRVRIGINWAAKGTIKPSEHPLTRVPTFDGPGMMVAQEVGDVGYGGQVLLTHTAWDRLDRVEGYPAAGYPVVRQLGLFNLKHARAATWLYEVRCLVARPLLREYPALRKDKAELLLPGKGYHICRPPSSFKALVLVAVRVVPWRAEAGAAADALSSTRPPTLGRPPSMAYHSTMGRDASLGRNASTSTQRTSRKSLAATHGSFSKPASSAPGWGSTAAGAAAGAAAAAAAAAGGRGYGSSLNSSAKSGTAAAAAAAVAAQHTGGIGTIGEGVLGKPSVQQAPPLVADASCTTESGRTGTGLGAAITSALRWRSQARLGAAGGGGGGSELPLWAQARVQNLLMTCALQFGGYSPHDMLMLDRMVFAFPDARRAACFMHATQLYLLYTDWSHSRDGKRRGYPTAVFGPRVETPDGRLVFMGPRVAMAMHAALDVGHEVCSSPITYESACYWPPGVALGGPGVRAAEALSEVAAGGQMVLSQSAWKAVQGRLPPQLQVLSLGVHEILGYTGNVGEDQRRAPIMEIVSQVMPLRWFPPLPSVRMVEPGYRDSPDPAQDMAICFVKVVKPREVVDAMQGVCSLSKEEAVSLLTAYYCGVKIMQDCLRQLLLLCDGYECKEPEVGKFTLAFGDLSQSVRFCCLLQEALLHVDCWPPRLLQWAQCKPEVDADSGLLLWSGLRVRAGLSWGRPDVRKPLNTGRADYFGSLANLAARLCASAAPGQVLVQGTDTLRWISHPLPRTWMTQSTAPPSPADGGGGSGRGRLGSRLVRGRSGNPYSTGSAGNALFQEQQQQQSQQQQQAAAATLAGSGNVGNSTLTHCMSISSNRSCPGGSQDGGANGSATAGSGGPDSSSRGPSSKTSVRGLALRRLPHSVAQHLWMGSSSPEAPDALHLKQLGFMQLKGFQTPYEVYSALPVSLRGRTFEVPDTLQPSVHSGGRLRHKKLGRGYSLQHPNVAAASAGGSGSAAGGSRFNGGIHSSANNRSGSVRRVSHESGGGDLGSGCASPPSPPRWPRRLLLSMLPSGSWSIGTPGSCSCTSANGTTEATGCSPATPPPPQPPAPLGGMPTAFGPAGGSGGPNGIEAVQAGSGGGSYSARRPRHPSGTCKGVAEDVEAEEEAASQDRLNLQQRQGREQQHGGGGGGGDIQMASRQQERQDEAVGVEQAEQHAQEEGEVAEGSKEEQEGREDLDEVPLQQQDEGEGYVDSKRLVQVQLDAETVQNARQLAMLFVQEHCRSFKLPGGREKQ